jgi:hypothetical protein
MITTAEQSPLSQRAQAADWDICILIPSTNGDSATIGIYKAPARGSRIEAKDAPSTRINDVTTVTSCGECVITYDCLFECSWIGPDKRGVLGNWECAEIPDSENFTGLGHELLKRNF